MDFNGIPVEEILENQPRQKRFLCKWDDRFGVIDHLMNQRENTTIGWVGSIELRPLGKMTKRSDGTVAWPYATVIANLIIGDFPKRSEES